MTNLWTRAYDGCGKNLEGEQNPSGAHSADTFLDDLTARVEFVPFPRGKRAATFTDLARIGIGRGVRQITEGVGRAV
jgi:hypothetical protein